MSYIQVTFCTECGNVPVRIIGDCNHIAYCLEGILSQQHNIYRLTVVHGHVIWEYRYHLEIIVKLK